MTTAGSSMLSLFFRSRASFADTGEGGTLSVRACVSRSVYLCVFVSVCVSVCVSLCAHACVCFCPPACLLVCFCLPVGLSLSDVCVRVSVSVAYVGMCVSWCVSWCARSAHLVRPLYVLIWFKSRHIMFTHTWSVNVGVSPAPFFSSGSLRC